MHPDDDGDPDFPLGPTLEFLRRFWQVNHAVERLSSVMAKRLGVTAQQRVLLRVLGRHPGMRAGQLARLFHLDPGTVSTTLATLEARGLLVRRPDPHDRRRASLRLSAAGERLDRPCRGTVEHAVERLLDSTSDRGLLQGLGMLRQLVALLDDELTAPPAAKRRPVAAARAPRRPA